MILDAFTYFNEDEILNFRMKLLWEKVDKFIVVEANVTHAGNPKPFNFQENIGQFEWAAEKLLYYPMTIDISDLDLTGPKPRNYDPRHVVWTIENRQREGILTACAKFSDEDALIISDVDEIPSYHALGTLRSQNYKAIMVCEQQIISPSIKQYNPVPWRGSVFVPLKLAREHGTQYWRDRRNRMPYIAFGGWHLSYHGGAEKIKAKIEAFAHQELNKPQFTDIERLERCLSTGADIFGTPARNQTIGPDFYPEYFLEYVPEHWWNV